MNTFDEGYTAAVNLLTDINGSENADTIGAAIGDAIGGLGGEAQRGFLAAIGQELLALRLGQEEDDEVA